MRILLAATATLVLATAAAAAPESLPGGARWNAEIPANWNGTLLLWSRGYSATPGDPPIAPRDMQAALLAAGYALAGSDYGSGGWALAEAVPAQRAVVAAFAAKHGQPKRVIGWGASMGGLVTAALAEQEKPVIDGAAALCSSIGGALGMMNMALDGANALRTLQAPDAGLELMDVTDDRANGKRASDVVKIAMLTPEGRARVALAGVLGGIPGWSTPGSTQPAATDPEAQTREMAAAFAMGVFPPRQDQLARAGGVYSWTTGVDYARLLNQSGRRGFVASMYRKAGLNLQADLKRLNAAPRVTADPKAVSYMRANYTPNARPKVPVVLVQSIGDGATSPSLQRAYADAARSPDVQSLWVNQAGHCNFQPAVLLATIRHLEQRLQSGRWARAPQDFVPHTPAPMLRPCVAGGVCR